MDLPNTGELLESARDGSPEAREELFERLARRLLPLIRLRLGPRLRARLESGDILQATLLKAHERLGQLRGSDAGELMAWLGRIAQNEILDQAEHHGRERRDQNRLVAADLAGIAQSARSVASRVVMDEDAHHLERALESLPAEHREVIIMRRLEELSYAAIAERLGRSPDACRMLFARGMAMLSTRMGSRP